MNENINSFKTTLERLPGTISSLKTPPMGIGWEKQYNYARVTKQSYPVLWLGEDKCAVTGFGRLIEIETDMAWYSLLINDAEIKYTAYDLHPVGTCIVTGGVTPPVIVNAIAMLKANRDRIDDILAWFQTPAAFRYVLEPKGAKDRTNIIVFEEAKPSYEEDLTTDVIANCPPSKYLISPSNKVIKCIK